MRLAWFFVKQRNQILTLSVFLPNRNCSSNREDQFSIYIISATLWFKGWEGGFPPCFCWVAKIPAHSFSHPLPFFLVKNEATPPALWRGVVDRPQCFVEKGLLNIRCCNSFCGFMFAHNCFKKPAFEKLRRRISRAYGEVS